jgi:hypothetical protein
MHVEEFRYAYGILSRILKGRDHVGDTSVWKGSSLTWMFEVQGRMTRTIRLKVIGVQW